MEQTLNEVVKVYQNQYFMALDRIFLNQSVLKDLPEGSTAYKILNDKIQKDQEIVNDLKNKLNLNP